MRVQENVEVTHDPLQMEGGCRCERRGPFGGSHPFHAQQPAGETQALPNVTLRAIEWRDLVALTPLEKAWELGLGLPWLILSLWCYGGGWWWAGLACSFYVFLTGLRQSHNAQHYSLGLPRRLQDCVLFALSLLMLASMHAVQVTHLHHHRHCLEDADGEGATARLPWWRALLVGPLFYTRLHLSACRLGNREKRAWIARELIGIVFVIGFTFCLPAWSALRWHVAAMLAGECFTGFFAVWTVHRGCGVHEPGRTQRGRWLNLISYSMFFHAEHHLFPAVPTAHLAELAGRLDAVMPQIGQRPVLPFGAALPANKRIAGI
jgi:fatty acid desaturase